MRKLKRKGFYSWEDEEHEKTLKEKFEAGHMKFMYCWEWVRGKNGVGYGVIPHKKKSLLAHRVSYELHIGQIPEGKMICHHCDNPGCVNPAHLYAGTYQTNIDDMMRRRRHKSQKDLDKLLNSYFNY